MNSLLSAVNRALGGDAGHTFLWALALVVVGALVATGHVSPELLNYMLMALIGKAALPIPKAIKEANKEDVSNGGPPGDENGHPVG